MTAPTEADLAQGAEADATDRHHLIAALTAERVRRHLTTRDIADRAGTTAAIVEAVESGARDPRLSLLQRYARAVGARLHLGVETVTSSPELRAWLAGAKEPTGPGKPDDLAELMRRMDELMPGVVRELRAEVAELQAEVFTLTNSEDALRAAAEGKAERLEAELAARTARLEEASAVIILAGQQVSLDSRAWVTLDDYDGSGDSCRELERLGYMRSGDGGWYGPDHADLAPQTVRLDNGLTLDETTGTVTADDGMAPGVESEAS